MMKYVVLIPAYKPSAFLPDLLKELALLGFENIVIDGDSGTELVGSKIAGVQKRRR